MTQTCINLDERIRAAERYNKTVALARRGEGALSYFSGAGAYTPLTCEPTLQGLNSQRLDAAFYTKRAVDLFREQIIEKAKDLAVADVEKLLEIPLPP